MINKSILALKHIAGVLVFIVWLFVEFVLHLICFDALETNEWYLYLEALVAFVFEIGLLCVEYKALRIRWSIVVSAWIYTFLTISSLIDLIVSSIAKLTFNSGLWILSIILDCMGIFVCVFMCKQSKNNRK